MSSGRVYLLLFVVFSLTASLAFAATVSVAPATAAPGASIKVSGSGFAPAETINLMFENAAIARATADESGQFALSLIFQTRSSPESTRFRQIQLRAKIRPQPHSPSS